MAPVKAALHLQAVREPVLHRDNQSVVVGYPGRVHLSYRHETGVRSGGRQTGEAWEASVYPVVLDALVIAMVANIVEVDGGVCSNPLLQLEVPLLIHRNL